MKPLSRLMAFSFLFFIYAQHCPAQISSDFTQEINPKSISDSTEIQKKTIQAIMERYGPDLHRLNVNSKGIVHGFFGSDLNKGLTAKDPGERVFQFLEMNKDIFKIENPKEQFRIVDYDRTEAKFPDVSLEQVENGVVVLGGQYDFRFLNDSSGIYQIGAFKGNFCPEARGINTKPSISAEKASQFALGDTICRGQNPSVKRNPMLYIRYYDKQLKLVWSVNLEGINTCESKIYIFNIDAQNGKVLTAKCYNRMP